MKKDFIKYSYSFHFATNKEIVWLRLRGKSLIRITCTKNNYLYFLDIISFSLLKRKETLTSTIVEETQGRSLIGVQRVPHPPKIWKMMISVGKYLSDLSENMSANPRC